tara:strand:- start:644 stop:1264 length:621 start_codon:yes stop_codon:yes gene_type:complete
MKKKSDKKAENKDKALLELLPVFGFDGWSETVFKQFQGEGKHEEFRDALDAALYFSDWADRRMTEKIAAMKTFNSLKIREKIFTGVKTRLDVLLPHKQAVKNSVRFMSSSPVRGRHVPKMLWHTADQIWFLAGDTATDYNHYTKRMLLSGVLATTTAFWLRDESENHEETEVFLQKRIENVLSFGKAVGKVKKAGAAVFQREEGGH